MGRHSVVIEQTEVAERGTRRDHALVRAALSTLGARLIATIATIATLAVAAKSLSSAELGVVAVLTLLTVFLGFGDFGLGTLLMTRLPAAHARGDHDERRELVGTTLAVLCGTGALIGVLGALSTFLMPWPSLLGAERLPDTSLRAAVLVFFLVGAISIPAATGGRVLAAMLRTAASQLWLAAGSVAAFVLTCVCAGLQLPMWTYVLAIAGTPALLAAVQTVWVLWFALPELRPATLRVARGTAVRYLRAGSMFAVMAISAALAYSIDSLIVSSVLDASAAAVFALAARLFALVGTTIGLAGQQMWSALADAVTRGDVAWVRARYLQVLVISTGVTGSACVFLVVFGRPLTRLWVGSDLVPPLSLLVVLAVYTIVSTTVTQASYLLAAVEEVKTIALLGIVMAAVNVVASIVLTRALGVTGPILGSLLGLVLVMIGPLIYLIRRQLTALAPPLP